MLNLKRYKALNVRFWFHLLTRIKLKDRRVSLIPSVSDLHDDT